MIESLYQSESEDIFVTLASNIETDPNITIMAMTGKARIVSLIASATEIVCALDLFNSLVGRSHECDYPEEVKRLPVCTSPKFPTTGTSAEIDQRVKDILRDALSVYSVDAQLVDSLSPTHLITQA